MILDYAALVLLATMPIMLVVTAIMLGSIPGKIARDKNHPWADAVNVASWVGLATIALWPLALIWAYLPLPRREETDAAIESGASSSLRKAKQRIAELESEIASLKSQLGDSSP